MPFEGKQQETDVPAPNLTRELNQRQIQLAQMMGMDIVEWVDTYAKEFGVLYTEKNKDKPTEWFLEQLRGPLN